MQMAVHVFVILTQWERNETVVFSLHSAAHHTHFCSIYQKCVENKQVLKPGGSWPIKKELLFDLMHWYT